MSADASAFSCLPLAVRDSLLQQAFQQLDQRHLFGVASRVCRLWHQLSLSSSTRLDVKITTEAAAEQFSLWMQNHGAAGLLSLLLCLDQAICRTPAARSLGQSLRAAMQLRSLRISTDNSFAVLDVRLSHLTNLTSLSIKSCILKPAVLRSILRLRSLNSLSLSHIWANVHGGYCRHYLGRVMKQMATRLVGLTSLDLGVAVSPEGLAHLRALPQLKRLSLGITVATSSLRHLNALPVTSIHIHSTAEQLSDVSSWLHSAALGLEHLVLHNYGGWTAPVCLLPFHKAVDLQSLRLWSVKPDLTQLAALTQLTSLSLTQCRVIDADVCMLAALTGLQNLRLCYNPDITGAQGSMEVLARSMPQLATLGLVETAAQAAAQQAFLGRRLLIEVEPPAALQIFRF